MTSPDGTPRTAAVHSLVREALAVPDALLAAFNPEGFRVAWPEAVSVPADRLLPVPEEPATLLALVRPQDQMPVVAAWHGVLAAGRGVVDVTLLGPPCRCG